MDKSAINRITAIRDKYKAIAEEAGDNYNLFKVIGLTSEEVRIHSAFLANLLNPQAEHGQKSKFLKLFCEQLIFHSSITIQEKSPLKNISARKKK